MPDQVENKGFKIPEPTTDKGQPANSNVPLSTSQTKEVDLPKGTESGLPQPRDYAIAGGALLVLLIAFFFAKNAYANHLAKRRVSAGSANAAAWWLFIFLTGLATAAVLSILSPAKFMTLIFMGPLLLISVVALVLMFVTGRRS